MPSIFDSLGVFDLSLLNPHGHGPTHPQPRRFG